MTAKLMVFIGLLVLNTLIVILYLVWNLAVGGRKRKNGKAAKETAQAEKTRERAAGAEKAEGKAVQAEKRQEESAGAEKVQEKAVRAEKMQEESAGAEKVQEKADRETAGAEKTQEQGVQEGAASKGSRRNGVWMRAAVMFLCPVAGPCMFLFSQIFFRLFFSKPVDLEDVVFSKERVRTFVHADEDRERNIVPLEEAIEVTEAGELRNLMMNVVRGDISKSLASIALALNSEDSETAHYAASVLQDALNDFRFHVQKQFKLIQSEEENQTVYAEALIDYMNQVLEQKVFADMEQKSYVDIMDQVCEVLYGRDREHMTSAQYEAVSLRLLEVGDYDKCRKWCERAEYQYPNTLATYTCQLKLYFNSGQKQKFFEVMEALKHSAVVIDSETLELIRVFR